MASYHVIRLKPQWKPNKLHGIDHEEATNVQEYLNYLESFDSSVLVSLSVVPNSGEVIVVARTEAHEGKTY